MIHQPLLEDDPKLRQISAELSRFELRARSQQLEIQELLRYVDGRGNKGVGGVPQDRASQSVVGLSANQLGIMKQICIVDLSIGRKGYHDLYVLVNPRIVWSSKSAVHKNEGCVNFPTTRGTTTRAKSIRIEALDRSGNEISLRLTGWASVLLQHEIDHLAGHLFIDRLVDPKAADHVPPGEYASYRKRKDEWTHKIDVSLSVK